MDLLANDLSIHRQFGSFAEFHNSLKQFMHVRSIAKSYGRDIFCHQSIYAQEPISGISMQPAIGRLNDFNQRRAVMGWLTRGPFWDEEREHHPDEWFECLDDIVTDSAIAEATFRSIKGVETNVVSFSPSKWLTTPIFVAWHRDDQENEGKTHSIENYWTAEALENALKKSPLPICSWKELHMESKKRYTKLSFSEDCFNPLKGVPFAKNSAERVLTLLGILHRLTISHDAHGKRNKEGHEIYQEYFTNKGKSGLFSDSSDTEKQRFRDELTFSHPHDPTASLFCPMHGKIPHLNLRLHFSWPIRPDRPAHIVYIGPKITKR